MTEKEIAFRKEVTRLITVYGPGGRAACTAAVEESGIDEDEAYAIIDAMIAEQKEKLRSFGPNLRIADRDRQH